MTQLACELVNTEDGLRSLLSEWELLWRTAGSPPFQAPAWAIAWWEQFGTSRPRVAVLRNGGLVGLLALYEQPDEGKILPIGVGLSDYVDVLLAPGAAADAASALLRAALQAARYPVHLTNLPQNSPLRDAATPHGWRSKLRETEPCPVLSMKGTHSLTAVVPARQLRKLRMARHRADRAGGWSIEEADPESLAELLGALIHLHTDRWQSRGGGVLSDPRVLAFHRAAAPPLCETQVLRLFALRLRGRLAAIAQALAAPGRLLCYLQGFDREFAFFSPGTLLLGAVIEQAMKEGRREIDFLRGGEHYKYAWGAVDRMNAERILWRS
jgi:CelD/BcsL family acetyltransferase involved in cellulose biosynthesis